MEWTDFRNEYRRVVQNGGQYLTAPAAIPHLARVPGARVLSTDRGLSIVLAEIVPGWTVIGLLADDAKVEWEPVKLDVSATGQFEVERSGQYYNLDNNNTAWDPHGLNAGKFFEKGVKAPEGAFEFGEFSNSNNYGYRWILPHPLPGAQPFSSTWAAQWVYVLPPDGMRVGCIMEK